MQFLPIIFWVLVLHALRSAYFPGQTKVLGHDRRASGVDGAEIGVFKRLHQECLGCLLETKKSCRLEPDVRPVVGGYLLHQALKRLFLQEKIGVLLVAPDLPDGNATRPPPMALLRFSPRDNGAF